jgi:hypothetical protein
VITGAALGPLRFMNYRQVGLLFLAGPLSTIASTTVANGLSLALGTWPSPRC